MLLGWGWWRRNIFRTCEITSRTEWPSTFWKNHSETYFHCKTCWNGNISKTEKIKHMFGKWKRPETLSGTGAFGFWHGKEIDENDVFWKFWGLERDGTEWLLVLGTVMCHLIRRSLTFFRFPKKLKTLNTTRNNPYRNNNENVAKWNINLGTSGAHFRNQNASKMSQKSTHKK